MCLKGGFWQTVLNLTSKRMIVQRQMREIYEETFWKWPQTGGCPKGVSACSVFGWKSKGVGKGSVSAINTLGHADWDLILFVRCLYFCLNFKSYFIVLWEEQKVLGSVIGYCFEKERKLPFIFSPSALNPQ